MIVNGTGRRWERHPGTMMWMSEDGHCVSDDEFRDKSDQIKHGPSLMSGIELSQVTKNGGDVTLYILDKIIESRSKNPLT